MADSERYQGYRVHGAGVSSLPAGFDDIAMPAERRGEAMTIVRELLGANGVAEDALRWYRTEGKPELCCYWADHHNRMWINPGNVHVVADTTLVGPTDWANEHGEVGWLLPGADRGTGGGRPAPSTAKVRCPVTFLWQPAGTECPDCEVVHP